MWKSPARRNKSEKTLPSSEDNPNSLPAPLQGWHGGDAKPWATLRIPIPIQIFGSRTQPFTMTGPETSFLRDLSGKTSVMTSHFTCWAHALATHVSRSTSTTGSTPKASRACDQPVIPAKNSAHLRGPLETLGWINKAPPFMGPTSIWITSSLHATVKSFTVTEDALAMWQFQISGTWRTAHSPDWITQCQAESVMSCLVSTDNTSRSPPKASMGEGQVPKEESVYFLGGGGGGR